MNMVRCPNCHINLTAAESKSSTCPVCSESLAELHNPTIDKPSSSPYEAATGSSFSMFDDMPSEPASPHSAPSPLPRVTVTASAPRATGGGAAKLGWIIIPIIVLAARGAMMLNRTMNRPSYNSSYSTSSQLNDRFTAPREIYVNDSDSSSSGGYAPSTGSLPSGNSYDPYNGRLDHSPGEFPSHIRGGSSQPWSNSGRTSPYGRTPGSPLPRDPRPISPRPSIPSPSPYGGGFPR